MCQGQEADVQVAVVTRTDSNGQSTGKMPAFRQTDLLQMLTATQADAIVVVYILPTNKGVIIKLSLFDGQDNSSLGNFQMTPADLAANSNAPGTSSGTSDVNGTTQAGLPDLNAKVLQFAQGQLGQRVGDGQCYALAAEALKAAGARPPQGREFGTPVALADALPGDVITFHEALFQSASYWMVLGMPDHVAIIEKVDGNHISVLHQNINQGPVQRDVINLDDMQHGTLKIFRPVAADATDTNTTNTNTNTNTNSATQQNPATQLPTPAIPKPLDLKKLSGK